MELIFRKNGDRRPHKERRGAALEDVPSQGLPAEDDVRGPRSPTPHPLPTQVRLDPPGVDHAARDICR